VSKAVLALAASVLLAAGCAQEGKLIDVPLPVNGVSTDILYTRSDTTRNSQLVITKITKVYQVNFKISIHAASPCEAHRGLLELRNAGSSLFPKFTIRPVARYNLDDQCTALPAGESDSVFTLTVASLPLAITPFSDAGAQLPDVSAPLIFQVETTNGPTITTVADSAYHSQVGGTTQFDVRVERQATADSVAGATVTIEQLGSSPAVLGIGTTNAGGRYVLNTPNSGIQGIGTIPYRVTVTDGVTTRVVSVPSFPARTQFRERVVVRL
jgi:hypothetical protein